MKEEGDVGTDKVGVVRAVCYLGGPQVLECELHCEQEEMREHGTRENIKTYCRLLPRLLLLVE